MIVCHCLRLTDRDLRRAERRGADSLEDLERASRAGTACGGCRPTVEWIVRVEQLRRPAPRDAAPSTPVQAA